MSRAAATPGEEFVRIFDTTLRDGEQAPGCTMTRDEKLEVARQLARLRVDVIEAGFPAASPGDWEAVRAVAGEVGTSDGPVICGLARASPRDVDRCWSAIEPAAKRRIHTFIATSDLHLEHKLRMTRAQVVETVAAMVSYAHSLCPDVEFSPEDAGRSDPEFLHEVLAIAVQCGATTLNIPDTVGYTTPEEYGAMIAGIRAHVAGVERVVLSAHCHDDLGLAVANSLAGVRGGVRQVECTINGIGERAGNASLEEVVMALHARRQFFGVTTGIDTRELARTSRLVSACTGVRVPPNKAVVGANAFAHEAGIHQDGVLKNPLTYEIMRAETVGWDGSTLVLGKHSGRHALRVRLEALGHRLGDDELLRVFERFKEVADKKKVVEERDLEALVADEVGRPPALYALEGVQVTCGTHAIPVATVRLRGPDGVLRTESAQGTGPVDAVCHAINKIAGDPGELVGCTIDAVTEGLNAIGQVTVRVRRRGEPSADDTAGGWAGARGRERICTGHGANLDIVVAAADAYLAVVNKLAQEEAADRAGTAVVASLGPLPPASTRVAPAQVASA